MDGPGGIDVGSNKVNITYDDTAFIGVSSYGSASIVQNSWRDITGARVSGVSREAGHSGCGRPGGVLGRRDRELPERRDPPPAARRVDRQPALALPGLRDADRGRYDNVPSSRGSCCAAAAGTAARRSRRATRLVELLTALVFAAVALVRGLDDDLVLELPFVAALIALAGIDLDHRLLPNKIVYPLAVYAVVATLLVDRGDLVEHLIAGAGAFLFLLVAALAYPRGMGMGDVKLAGAMGLYLGLSVIPALLSRSCPAPSSGSRSSRARGPPARKKAVPFGVFLALGGIVGVLAGPELIDLYETNFLANASRPGGVQQLWTFRDWR